MVLPTSLINNALSPAIQPPTEEEKQQLNTPAAILIKSLAINTFQQENTANDYTLSKLRLLKEEGKLSPLNPSLASSEIHRILFELDVIKINEDLRASSQGPSEGMDKLLKNMKNMTNEQLMQEIQEMTWKINLLEVNKKKSLIFDHFRQTVHVLKESLGKHSALIDEELILDHATDILNQIDSLENLEGFEKEWQKRITSNGNYLLKHVGRYMSFFDQLHKPLRLAKEVLSEWAKFFLDAKGTAPFYSGLLIEDENQFKEGLDKKFDEMIHSKKFADWKGGMHPEVRLRYKLLRSLGELYGVDVKGLTIPERIKFRLLLTEWNPDVLKDWDKQRKEQPDEFLKVITSDPSFKEMVEPEFIRIKNSRYLDSFFYEVSEQLRNIIPPKQPHSEKVLERYLLLLKNEITPAILKNQKQFDNCMKVMKSIINDPKWEGEFLELVKENPLIKKTDGLKARFLETFWDKEIGPGFDIYRQKVVDDLFNMVNASLVHHHPFTDISVTEMNELITQIRRNINQEELKDLKTRLEALAPAKKVEEVLQLVDEGIISGSRLLTQQEKERMISLLEFEKRRIDKRLSIIKHDLDVGSAYANWDTVLRQYNLTPEDLNTIQSKELISKLYKAKLELELKNRFPLVQEQMNEDEKLVLILLGYNPEPREAQQQRFRLVRDEIEGWITGRLSSSRAPDDQETLEESIKSLRQKIKVSQDRARLMAAGVPNDPRILENVRLLIARVPEWRSQVKLSIAGAQHEEFMYEDFRGKGDVYEKVRNYGEVVLDQITEDKLYLCLLGLEKILPDLINEKSERFNKFLQDVDLGEIAGTIIGKDLDKMIDSTKKRYSEMRFFKKWAHRLAVGSIQGFKDKSEALGKGVCFAKSMRIAKMQQENPDLPVEELGAESILPIDRHRHAKYSIAWKMGVDKHTRHPRDVMKVFGFQNVHTIAALDTVDKLQNLIVNSLGNDALNKKTNGVYHISISGPDWGHRMDMRCDVDRGIYRLHDPNIGVFEIRTGTTDAESKAALKELSDIMKDLLETEYPDVNAINVFKLT